MLRPRYITQRNRLDQRITIQRKSDARDAMNEPVEDWTDQFSTRAIAYPTPGFERQVTDANVATQPMTFEVRAEARTHGILPSDRVRWDSGNGRIYNLIAPVEQPERGRNLRLICAADQ